VQQSGKKKYGRSRLRNGHERSCIPARLGVIDGLLKEEGHVQQRDRPGQHFKEDAAIEIAESVRQRGAVNRCLGDAAGDVWIVGRFLEDVKQ
jgi:hypothetical protein